MKTIVAFANTQSGKLFIGIDDNMFRVELFRNVPLIKKNQSDFVVKNMAYLFGMDHQKQDIGKL